MTQHENTTPNRRATNSGGGPAIAIVAVVALVALVIALFFFMVSDSGGQEGDGSLIESPIEMGESGQGAEGSS